MFHLVFFILLLSTSTGLVDALICATDCSFSTNIDNITYPSCAVVDKPDTVHNCQVLLLIDYASGSVNGRINPRMPPISFTFDAVTIFSLYDGTSQITIEIDCSETDNCDQEFVKEVLRGDWLQVQNQVTSLRKNLTDMLFNSSDLRPYDTCPAGQQCSGEGFCKVAYQAWTDQPFPSFQSTCTNSTEQPAVQWIQAFDQTKAGEVLFYTCNEPSCASPSTAASVIQMLEREYVLPFNVTIPPTTTQLPTTPTTPITTQSAITSTTPAMTSTSTVATTPKNAARSAHLDNSEKIVFACVSFLFLCLFRI